MRNSQFPVFPLVWEAVRELNRNRGVLVPALILPSCGMIGVSWLSETLDPGISVSMISGVINLVLYSLFAISCHRVIILGATELPNSLGVYWTSREAIFLVRFFALAIFAGIISIPILFPLLLLPKTLGPIETSWLRDALTYVFVSYFVMRFGLSLPAVAVGNRLTFSDSWSVTTGHGMLLTLAVCVPAFLTYLLHWILDLAIGETSVLLAELPYFIATFLLMAVDISILSIAYKYLVYVDPNASTTPEQ